MRHYFINKEWILSDQAKRIYRFAAFWAIALVPLIIGAEVFELPEFLVPLFKVLLLLSVLGAATTLVAMEYFLFGFDRNPAWKKTLWFFVCCFVPLGPAVYCLMVYVKCDPVECAKPKAVEEVIG
jgi:hypothetical protein